MFCLIKKFHSFFPLNKMYFCCCCQIPVLVLLRRIDSLGLFQLKHLSQIRGCQIGIGKSPTKNLKFSSFYEFHSKQKERGFRVVKQATTSTVFIYL